MTYYLITDERMRHEAARTLARWRKQRDEHRVNAKYAKEDFTRTYENATAQMSVAWTYGYRRALQDLGEE
jgi:hypothetical protein